MLYINAKPGDKLNLGRKGENRARTILFDISQWRKLYGDGVASLLHQRAGDAEPYPCDIQTDGNTVAWEITNADTAVASQYGKYELQYRVNDQLAKSATGAASVYDALGEQTAEPPEAQQGWVDKVLQAGAEAEAAADRAEEAAIRQPVPNEETGTWWLWDAEKGEYVDSGVSSSTEGGSGTTDHDKLGNRDAADQHPMSAITGLEKALGEKQPKGSYLTTDSLNNAVNDALAQAKESGEFDGVDGKDGQDGYTPVKGKDYFDGTNGKDGKDATSPVISVSNITGGHRITIKDVNGTKTVDVMDGEDGSNGKDGNGIKSAVLNADYTLTLTFDNGTKYTTPSIRGASGADGKDGNPGKDGADGIGIRSVEQTTTSTEDGGENIITVTKTDGTQSTFTVKNGGKGSDGQPGQNGADGKTPVKGTDYWTDADKTAIVNDVLAALPTWTGGSY